MTCAPGFARFIFGLLSLFSISNTLWDVSAVVLDDGVSTIEEFQTANNEEDKLLESCYGNEQLGFNCVPFTKARFGSDLPPPDQDPITAVLAVAETLMCDNTQEDFTDKIVLIQRDDCFFHNKSLNAMEQGAVAVVLHMSDNSDLVIPIYNEEDETSILTIMISLDDANRIKTLIASGETVIFSVGPGANDPPNIPANSEPPATFIEKPIGQLFLVTVGISAVISVAAFAWARHRIRNPRELVTARHVDEGDDLTEGKPPGSVNRSFWDTQEDHTTFSDP